jgi:hypothetical protein
MAKKTVDPKISERVDKTWIKFVHAKYASDSALIEYLSAMKAAQGKKFYEMERVLWVDWANRRAKVAGGALYGRRKKAA